MAGARLARLGEIAGELGADDLASDAHAEQRRLEEARFLVACVGEFKRGKSTLINALVGQSAQCHPESGGRRRAPAARSRVLPELSTSHALQQSRLAVPGLKIEIGSSPVRIASAQWPLGNLDIP
jgi:septin family protein